jgi:hypothetical protein
MINDQLKVTGKLSIRLNGEELVSQDNYVTRMGKQWVINMMAGTATAMTHMAIGTGTLSGGVWPGETSGDYKQHLVTEVNVVSATPDLTNNNRQSITTLVPAYTAPVDEGTTTADSWPRSIKYTGTFSPTNSTETAPVAIHEAGIFDSGDVLPLGGNMLARTEFAVVNKGPLDTIVIEWVISIS